MCGRFVQAEDARHYAEHFRVDVVKVDYIAPSYNVAPTDRVFAVAEYDEERLLGTFKWGLLPWWAKDRKMAARNINAPNGDGRRAACLPRFLPGEALPDSGRRILRMAAPTEGKAAPLHLCRQPQAAGSRRAVGFVEGPADRGQGPHVHDPDR